MASDEADGWVTSETVVNNTLGVHARPSSMVVQTAALYDAEITLSAPRFLFIAGQLVRDLEMWETIDATCIIAVLMLVLTPGTPVLIRARGPDAREAVEALKELFDSGCGEA